MTFTESYEKFFTSVGKCGKTYISVYLPCLAFSKYSGLKKCLIKHYLILGMRHIRYTLQKRASSSCLITRRE